jgi:hypothetical protein
VLFRSLLYEKGDYGTISLARFNLAWLTDSKDYGDAAYPFLIEN